MNELLKTKMDWVIIGIGIIYIIVVGWVILLNINSNDIVNQGIKDGYRITIPFYEVKSD